MKRTFALLLALLMLAGLAACTKQTPAAPAPTEAPAVTEIPAETEAPTGAKVADASQMTTVEEVTEEGMTPVYAESLLDGDYPVEVKSSSSMFRIEKALLHAENGAMTLTFTMGGKSYLWVYPGAAAEAAAAEESALIPYVEDADGAYTFTVPVEALDAAFPCAAYSKNKELWYDRSLLVRVDSLPAEAFREGFFVTSESLGLEDGRYMVEVTLSGGSGRAHVESPAVLYVRDGICTAVIGWSSTHYDYMKVDGVKYLSVPNEDNAAFEIPVLFFDRPMPVIADTTAMSEPHEIAYTLLFDSGSIEAAP